MGIYNLGGGGGAPELQLKQATPLITNAQQIILPDEGYDGLSKVTVNPMPTGTLKTPTVNSIGYVSAGVQTAGYFNTSATSGLQLSTQAAKTITPTTYSQTAVASGKYTTGAVTVAGDSDLVASNIKSGVNIFGVTGTAPSIFSASAETRFSSQIATGLFMFNRDNWPANTKIIAFRLEYIPSGVFASGGVYSIYFVSEPNGSLQYLEPIPSTGVATQFTADCQAKDGSMPNLQTAKFSISGNVASITITITWGSFFFDTKTYRMHVIFIG